LLLEKFTLVTRRHYIDILISRTFLFAKPFYRRAPIVFSNWALTTTNATKTAMIANNADFFISFSSCKYTG